MSNIRFVARNIDVASLLEEVAANDSAWEEAWRAHEAGAFSMSGNRARGTYIPLVTRRPGARDHDTFELAPTFLFERFPKITAWVKSHYDRPGRMYIYRIPPKQRGIPRHIDAGEYYRLSDRHHLCLQGRYRYEVDGEEAIVEAGDHFWFDNQKPHSVENIGDVDRVSIVFDVLPAAA